MDLENKVTMIPGIGKSYALVLERLGIFTIEDLLMHIPYRYEDHSNIIKISELVVNTPATVIGEIVKIDAVFTRYGKKLTKAVIEDNTGKLNVLWFNQPYLKKSIPIGTTIAVSGELDPKEKKPQFTSPEWEVVKDGKLLHTGGLIPVYSGTEGLSSKWLRQKIKVLIDNITIENKLPETVIQENGFPDRYESFSYIHDPTVIEDVEKGKAHLGFEELFFLHLKGIVLQSEWDRIKNGHIINLPENDRKKLTDDLPFELTKAQIRSIDEIMDDLNNDMPMNRLLQGDVGSGKTAVAVFAALACLKSGYNCIYMAPTQILAQQHFKNFSNLLKGFGCNVLLLTGTEKKTEILKEPYIVISTHAVLYNLKAYSNIGLIIVDEQHKFGVDQRTKIIDHYTKDLTPNLLTMTATPIPRSLALTLYGDLKLSQIDEMPVNRKEVVTWVVEENKRTSCYEWIKKQIQDNKTQVFVVCPFIQQSQAEMFEDVKSAEIEYEKIRKIFKEYNVGLLHGRLKNIEKETVINDFLEKKLDILVTTPVIEVGVDIPGANIILIETPERFGLASLHQLRGRVGRGKEQGYCVLMASANKEENRRLKYMETIHNGNKLAEMDLKLRGPGNIYGTIQHGFINLKVADITDIDLIRKTKKYAHDIFLSIDKYPKIKKYTDKIKIADN